MLGDFPFSTLVAFALNVLVEALLGIGYVGHSMTFQRPKALSRGQHLYRGDFTKRKGPICLFTEQTLTWETPFCRLFS